MADVILTNIASASGSYDGVPTAMDSTAVTTLLVDGLRIEKTADKETWVNGTLIYTITVTNKATHAYVDPLVTDSLDPAVITLVEGSVMVNGATTTDYTYDTASGLLSVPVPDIAVGGSAVVTFQVRKI